MTRRSTSSKKPLKPTEPYPMQEERVYIGGLDAPQPGQGTYDPPPPYVIVKTETSEPQSRSESAPTVNDSPARKPTLSQPKTGATP